MLVVCACDDSDDGRRRDAAVAPGNGGLDAAASDARPVDAGALDGAALDAVAVRSDAAVDASALVAVPLQNATATFSQTNPPIFLIGDAINGTSSDNLGWAINPAITDQTAAFETVANTPAFASGTKLRFTLEHRFPVEHALGKFRLSYTTADRVSFADGNDGSVTPGNVGAPSIWVVLQPTSASATGTATLAIKPDGSVLAADVNATDVVYTITSSTPATGITGFRLEVLRDESLPMGGPGLQDSNGNFVLSEFSVTAQAL